jgi:hypothetical protein
LTKAQLRTEIALWLALFAGFSPVILQFVRFEAWYAPSSTLAAPALIAISLWKGIVQAEPPRRAGAALIAAGLMLEVLGVALRVWTVAWLGLPVAVIGMALWLGRPSWRIAVLALGLVPIPESIRGAYTPAAETAVLGGACAAWRALGVAFSCTGPVARLGDRHLELLADDAGWTLAPLLGQLGWFLAVSRGSTGRSALLSSMAFASVTVLLQPLAIALALGLLMLSSEEVARTWVSEGLWIGCAGVAVLWSLRAARVPELLSERR